MVQHNGFSFVYVGCSYGSVGLRLKYFETIKMSKTRSCGMNEQCHKRRHEQAFP